MTIHQDSVGQFWNVLTKLIPFRDLTVSIRSNPTSD